MNIDEGDDEYFIIKFLQLKVFHVVTLRKQISKISNMRPIKTLLIIIAALMLPTFQAIANDPIDLPETSEGDGGYLERDKGKDPGNRPQAPDRQMIFCQYDGEELTFSFAYSEGECEVQLTDRYGLTQFYTIDSSELFASVYVGKIGYTEITLITERGITYTGVINRAQ